MGKGKKPILRAKSASETLRINRIQEKSEEARLNWANIINLWREQKPDVTIINGIVFLSSSVPFVH